MTPAFPGSRAPEADGLPPLGHATFRAFFEQSPFYASIVAPDGTLLDASRVSLARAGYARSQVLGKKFWDTGWWHGSKEVQARIQTGIKTTLAGCAFAAELPFYLADGTERVGEIVMSPIQGETGEVQFIIVTGVDITERARTDRELAVARTRIESAMIAGELGAYEWDIGADRLYGDANFARIFSVTLDATGAAPLKDYLAAIHPDDVPMIMRRIEHSIQTGADYEADYRILRDGDFRWVTARGRMTKDAAGRVVRFAGVVLDITGRKRAEDERAEVAEKLQRQFRIHDAIFSNTDDFAYIFDLQGRFVYANRRLLHVWARTLDQVIGKTCYDLGYPTWHADMHMREIEQVIATKQPIRGEVPFTGDSGISGIYDYTFTPVFGPDGEVESIAGTTRDVTERKRREDRDRLLLTVDDATRPLTDAREITQTSARLLGEAMEVNRCAYADVEGDEDTFNLTGDYNRGVASIVGRYRFAQFGEECLRLMREGKPFIVQDAESDPRTERVREAYRATSIRSMVSVPLLKRNRVVAVMAVHQTSPRAWRREEVEVLLSVASRCWESIERNRVQCELEAARARLEEHARGLEASVAERTAKLQETISELETFSYSISHDLRAPLRAMQSFASILATDCGDKVGEEGREYIRRIVGASERMDRLIQDVLVYSRISRNEIPVEPIELGPFIAGILESYPQFSAANADFDIVQPLGAVIANAAALTQCISNLVGNAIKFVGPGVKPAIRIWTERHGDRIRLFVRDNGLGIEEAAHEKIFGIFYQVDARRGGTGIGLSVVRKAAERMGGTVGLKSAPGQGSTFCLELPAPRA